MGARPRGRADCKGVRSNAREVERASYSYLTITRHDNLVSASRRRGPRSITPTVDLAPTSTPLGAVPSSVRGFLSDLDRLNHEVDRDLRDIRPFGTALHTFLL